MAKQRAGGAAPGFVEHAERDIEPIESAGKPIHFSDEGSDDGDSIPTVEPGSIISGDTDTGDAPRKRGRPRGAKPATAKATKQKAADLSGVLLSTHLMLALLMKTPELEIQEAEAKRLGDALTRVNEEFGGIVISPKTEAIINLVMAAGSVYGPRLIAIKMTAKKKRPAAASEPITIDAQPVSAGYSN